MGKYLMLVVQILFVVCWCQTNDRTGSASAKIAKTRPTVPPKPKNFDELLKQNKRVDKAMKSLPADVQERLKKGGSMAFKNISLAELKKLPPSAVAYIGRDAIRGMDRKQLKEITKQFRKTSTRDLQKILESVDSTQLDDILEEFGNSSEQLSFGQREAFIEHMKHDKGKDPSKWKKEDVKKLGSLITGFTPGDLKKLARNKETFEASLDQLKLGANRMSNGQKKAVIRGAQEAFGDPKTWNAEKLKKVSRFIQKLPAKQINKLPVGAVRDAVEDLGKEKWDPKKAREMLYKLKDKDHGFGNPKTWTADTVKKLGNLSTGFTPKDIKSLPADTIKGALKELAESAAKVKRKARELSKRMKEIYGKVSSWSPEIMKNAKHILKGLKPKDMKNLPASAVVKSMKDLKTVKFNKLQARELAEKVKLEYGSPKMWNKTVVGEMGPVMKGLRLAELEELDISVIAVAMESMAGDETVPPSKKRVIIRKVKEAGIPLVKAGSFIQEYSLDDLENTDLESDLGLTLDPADNSSDEFARGNLKWRKPQARMMLEKLKVKWGSPEDSGSQWTFNNIKRLYHMLDGVWKEFVLAFPVDGFTDFVEFFAEYRGELSPAQGKAIAEAFRIKLGYQSPDKFASFTDTLASILGPFVGDLEAEELGSIQAEAIPETVRQLGSSHLERIPKAQVKNKAHAVLEMLGKARSTPKEKLQPSELTADELQDMGKLVCGLEPAELETLDRAEVKSSIVAIADSAKICNVAQLESLATVAKDAFKKEDKIASVAEFTEDHLRDMGVIAAGLTGDDIKKMDKTLIENNLDMLSELDLSEEQASAVVTALETARRRRRAAADLASKTEDELIAMGSTLVGLTASDIATVSTTAFDGAVGEIGKIKGFKQAQLQAWAALAKKAWNSDVSLFTSDQLQSLGVIAVGFSADDLGKMNLATDDDIESLGSEAGYTSDQLNSAWSQVKTKKNKAVSSFTGDEIAALKTFAIAMTPTEIGQITTAAYKSAAATLGGLTGWSEDQMKKLKEEAVAAYGAVSKWTAAQLGDAGAAIGGFTDTEIEALTSAQIEVISPGAISQIPPASFEAFSVAQLQQFDSNQAAAVTSAQRGALSLEKQNTLLVIEGMDKITSGAGKFTGLAVWSSVGTLVLSLLLLV